MLNNRHHMEAAAAANRATLASAAAQQYEASKAPSDPQWHELSAEMREHLMEVVASHLP